MDRKTVPFSSNVNDATKFTKLLSYGWTESLGYRYAHSTLTGLGTATHERDSFAYWTVIITSLVFGNR